MLDGLDTYTKESLKIIAAGKADSGSVAAATPVSAPVSVSPKKRPRVDTDAAAKLTGHQLHSALDQFLSDHKDQDKSAEKEKKKDKKIDPEELKAKIRELTKEFEKAGGREKLELFCNKNSITYHNKKQALSDLAAALLQ